MRAFQCPDMPRVFVSESLDRFRQGFSGYALDRLFARGIDVCDEQGVGVIKRTREFLHQILCATVPMRLKEDDNASAAGTNFRRSKGRFDFSRMMPVVVDDEHAPNFSFALKTPPGAAETSQS